MRVCELLRMWIFMGISVVQRLLNRSKKRNLLHKTII